MNTKFAFLAFFLFVGTIAAQSQISPQPEPNYIDVRGTAKLLIVPDQIFLSITLMERMDSREKVTITEQESALRSGLLRAGVDLNKLSLADADASYVLIKRKQKDVITRKEYTLEVGDAEVLGRVYDQLDSVQIHHVSIVKLSHTKLDSLQKSVRISAIQAAKDKADYLLNAIGEKTGKPLIIREEGSPEVMQMRSNVVYNKSGYVEASQPIMQFKKIELQSTIYAKFAIQ